MWEEGERKRGWEVPLNGVRVVKDYIAEQKLAPQVTGKMMHISNHGQTTYVA